MFDWNRLGKTKPISTWVVDSVVSWEHSLKSLVAGFYLVYRRNYLTTTRTAKAEYVTVHIETLLLNRDLFQRNFVPSHKIYRNIRQVSLCGEKNTAAFDIKNRYQ